MRGLLIAVLLVGCSDTTTSTRIANLQARQAQQDQDIDRAEIDVSRLSASWDDVVARYQAVEEEYRQAYELHAMAVSEASEAEQASVEASSDWQEAQKLWFLYRTIVLVAIAIEAGRYEGRSVSCSEMSTAAFRRSLISQGISLVGKDIDHIVPRSLGGANHPMNYQVLDSSTNRSLGARWDADKCLMSGRKRCSEALAVSKKCGGYAGPWF